VTSFIAVLQAKNNVHDCTINEARLPGYGNALQQRLSGKGLMRQAVAAVLE
jgi:hypothetical protein